jgi:hypothetical protein
MEPKEALGWRELDHHQLDAFGAPSSAAVSSPVRSTSAASPPRSAHNFVCWDAPVWLGRCAFRTDPWLVQIPVVASFAPCRATVHLTVPRQVNQTLQRDRRDLGFIEFLREGS